MKFHYSNIKFLLMVFLLVSYQSANSATNRDSSAEATYRVTFLTNWTQERFSTNFPIGILPTSRPHFSGLVGATHNSQSAFWAPGQKATEGIEGMAETGSKVVFEEEIQNEKNKNNTEFLLGASALFAGVGTRTIEFDINSSHPLVTLVSMLAPSPDWFVGVHDLALLVNDEWIQTMEINLPLYDAGTDLGGRFKSENKNSSNLISLLTSASIDTDFQEGVSRNSSHYIAKFIFERIK